jgi:hypothetical protein
LEGILITYRNLCELPVLLSEPNHSLGFMGIYATSNRLITEKPHEKVTSNLRSKLWSSGFCNLAAL